ncbi:MAG: diguanylate cyclase, partial [Pseudomonadota bacterium]
LDVQMPDMNGFEAAELMRGSARTRHIPIIFVTAISKEQQHKFKGYRSGAVDYLFKPLEPEILISKVKVFLDLHRQKKTLENTTKQLKDALESLKKSNAELSHANKKIIEQQKSVIEEERLKVLMQLAGATFSDLNQPVVALLNGIDLMKRNKEQPDIFMQHLNSVEDAGREISRLTDRIQKLDHTHFQCPNQGVPFVWTRDVPPLILTIGDVEGFALIHDLMKNLRGMTFSYANNIGEAIERLIKAEYHLVITDYFLLDGTGLDLMKRLESSEIDVPLVVIASQGDEVIASQAIQAGAYDYMPIKSANEESVFRVITNALEKFRLRKEIGIAHKKMFELSTIDELTGLYNRRYFVDALHREFASAVRYNKELVLFMMDLDHFKNVNDTYGHPAGDRMLIEMSRILKEAVRLGDIACRYGGEEFTVILPSTDIKSAALVAERLRRSVEAHKVQHEQHILSITISIGIATISNIQGQQPEELIQLADDALYMAKREGRNRVVFSPQFV